jgi:hypothetical protein
MEITDKDDPGERDIPRCGGCNDELGPDDGIDECEYCLRDRICRYEIMMRRAQEEDDRDAMCPEFAHCYRDRWNGCYED